MVAFRKIAADVQKPSIVHVTEAAITVLEGILRQLDLLGESCFRIKAEGDKVDMTLDSPSKDDIALDEGSGTLLVMDSTTVKTLADRVLHFNEESSEFYWFRLVEMSPRNSNDWQ